MGDSLWLQPTSIAEKWIGRKLIAQVGILATQFATAITLAIASPPE